MTAGKPKDTHVLQNHIDKKEMVNLHKILAKEQCNM